MQYIWNLPETARYIDERYIDEMIATNNPDLTRLLALHPGGRRINIDRSELMDTGQWSITGTLLDETETAKPKITFQLCVVQSNLLNQSYLQVVYSAIEREIAQSQTHVFQDDGNVAFP